MHTGKEPVAAVIATVSALKRKSKKTLTPKTSLLTRMPTIREKSEKSCHRPPQLQHSRRVASTEMVMMPKEKHTTRISRAHSIRRVPQQPTQQPMPYQQTLPPPPQHARMTPNSMLQVDQSRASSTSAMIRLHPSQQVINTTSHQQQHHLHHHQQHHGESYSCIGSAQNSCENTLPPFTVWKNKNGESTSTSTSTMANLPTAAIEYIETPSPMKDDLGASYGEHKWNDLYYFGALSASRHATIHFFAGLIAIIFGESNNVVDILL